MCNLKLFRSLSFSLNVVFGASKFAVRSIPVRMASSVDNDYEKAVRVLNTLQSNREALVKIRQDIKSGQRKCTRLINMERYLKRTGVSLEKLDTLSVIHVAGTKGKGSTSAMCEAILRHRGFRTGFFSSPHLVSVCERIRLDGQMIDKKQFTSYFNETYEKLVASKEYETDMPTYFCFLTTMAFNAFIHKKVDVAILEVGIGGNFDNTNIVRNTPVVGITSLGLEHVSILGNSIEEIARQKAGIMKAGCQAYSVQQPVGAMEVLRTTANDVGCDLHFVPDFETYEWPKDRPIKLQVDIAAYKSNASLAIQLSNAWLRYHARNNPQIIDNMKNNYLNGNTNSSDDKLNGNSNMLNGNKNGVTPINGKINGLKTVNILNDNTNYSVDILPNGSIDLKQNIYKGCIKKVSDVTVTALSECHWPGRYQRIRSDFANFYLDGAHTAESLEVCRDWFLKEASNDRKILIFNISGDRDSERLLRVFTSVQFDTVIFAVYVTYKNIDSSSDQYSPQEHDELVSKCHILKELWIKMRHSLDQPIKEKLMVCDCIFDALNEVNKIYGVTQFKHSVLITGSLYLVGASLSILDPTLSNIGIYRSSNLNEILENSKSKLRC